MYYCSLSMLYAEAMSRSRTGAARVGKAEGGRRGKRSGLRSRNAEPAVGEGPVSCARRSFRHPWCGDEGFRRRRPSAADRGRFLRGCSLTRARPRREEVGSTMALHCARGLAGSKRRQECRFGGALRGLPRTRVPDASFFIRKRIKVTWCNCARVVTLRV